jgi:ComF family protein
VPGTDRCSECAFAASRRVACVAPVWFDAEVDGWIHRFKYPGRGLASLDPAAGAVLRHLILEARRCVPGPAPDLVVPVPLHPNRLRSRGFNPAAILARALARRVAVDVDPVALRRVRDTPSQTGLDARARRRNVRHAFRVRRGWHAPPRIWIVDDVVTTGSTLREAARALRLAGAETVTGVCAARTPRHLEQTLSSESTATPGATPRS